MTRFGLLVLFAAMSLGPLSCGSGGGESASNAGSGGSNSSAANAGASGGSGSGGGSVASGGSGGSSSAGDPIALLPVDNTVPGWTIDIKMNLVDGTAKPMTADTHAKASNLIDGGVDPFYSDGFSPKLFIWQNFKNSTLPDAPVDDFNPDGATLLLYVFQMPSADQASGLFKNLLKYSEYNARTHWEDPTDPAVGTGSRIQDTNSEWWINFYKDEYYVEVKLAPSSGPSPDFKPGDINLKKEAIRFAQAVASKL